MKTEEEIEAMIIELDFDVKSLENRMGYLINRKNYAYDQYLIAKREYDDYYGRIEYIKDEMCILSGVLE